MNSFPSARLLAARVNNSKGGASKQLNGDPSSRSAVSSSHSSASHPSHLRRTDAPPNSDSSSNGRRMNQSSKKRKREMDALFVEEGEEDDDEEHSSDKASSLHNEQHDTTRQRQRSRPDELVHRKSSSSTYNHAATSTSSSSSSATPSSRHAPKEESSKRRVKPGLAVSTLPLSTAIKKKTTPHSLPASAFAPQHSAPTPSADGSASSLARSLLTEWKRNERTKQRETGKAAFYLKRSELKKMEMAAKYMATRQQKGGDKQIEKMMEKRRRKVANRDHKYMPHQNNE